MKALQFKIVETYHPEIIIKTGREKRNERRKKDRNKLGFKKK
jgi:hypothetical protein